MKKIKFAYNSEEQKLFFSPLVFPSWDFKKTSISHSLFRNVPFRLPFLLPERIDTANKGALLRTYYNIYTVYTVSLAKAFVQSVLQKEGFSKEVKIRRSDLDAVLGVKATSSFIEGVRDFMSFDQEINFTQKSIIPTVQIPSNPKYNKFSEVIDDLKANYERKTKKLRSRIGVHYYIPYDILYKQYADHISLSQNLDFYCDFGALVPETIIYRHRVTRGCRTGEPIVDYNWQRTRVLIPLAIEQFRVVLNLSESAIEPTALNKLLSNFIFDYPSELNHELHCLIGVPFTFGTLVHVYHHHRAPSKPSLYNADRISPFYEWNNQKKKFIGRKPAHLMTEIKEAFDQRQEVPYSEIVTYFKFLARIYKHFKTVDVLNMLSICREQNYFYAHVLYNVRTATEDFGLYFDSRYIKSAKDILTKGEENAKSALTKLRLAKELPQTIKLINTHFGQEVDFLKTLEKLNQHYTPFGAEFAETLDQLNKLVRLQLVLFNLCMLIETNDVRYVEVFNQAGARDFLRGLEITLPENLRTFIDDTILNEAILKKIYGLALVILDSLPREEQPILITRLRNEARYQARNCATTYVYKYNLSQILLLYLDFSGLRDIPEPKEDQISAYYCIVLKNIRARGGVKLYGGKDGDDAFTVLFTDVRPALQCAKDIKQDFSEELLLRGNKSDIKFGMCFKVFQNQQKEQDVIQCWGMAKDCCEFKNSEFRNRGDLIVTEQTLENIRKFNHIPVIDEFTPLADNRLKDGSQIYRYNKIKPLT